MFNLDIELDFDDDFSTNVFVKQLDKIPETPSQPIKNTNQNHLSSVKPVEEPSWERVNDNNVQNQKFTNVNGSSDSFFNFPSTKESSPIPPSLKRPHSEDDRPQKRKLPHETLLQRKFPGPAGLLPDKPFKEIEDIAHPHNKSLTAEEEEECKNEPAIYSQSSGSVFLDSAYQKLVSDFDLNKPNNPLNKYKVDWVKKAAMSKALLGRKIPFLAVVLHSIDHGTPDPVLLLRDPTGEINGTLHREVWVDIGGKLRTGIGLALRQVGVLITGVIRRQVYLNITMNNILAVYNPSENESDVEITTINRLSKSELYKSVERWQAQVPPHPGPRSPAKGPTRGLFTTILDLDSQVASPSPRPTDEDANNLRYKLHNFVKQNQSANLPVKPKPAEREKETGKNSEEVLAGLGVSDFIDDMNVPLQGSTTRPAPRTEGGRPGGAGESSQVLSRAESLIFEEVLSGINLDEFEM